MGSELTLAIPDYQALMLPVLRAASQGEVRIGQVVEDIANQLNLTMDERSELLPSGKQAVFTNRTHWAKSYLSKAGLINLTKRAHFTITTSGSNLLLSNPTQINNKLLMQFEGFRQFQRKSNEISSQAILLESSSIQDQKQTPDEIIRLAHKQVDLALEEELLNRICEAPPDFFEKLIVNLLITMGYGGSTINAGRTLGRSGDDGVDGVIDQDALGLDRVYIQAKRYALGNNIGSGAIRDFFGSLDRHKAAKGLLVTTSTFSPAARETADHLSKRIVLIDGSQLAKLMIRHNVGCRVEDTFYIKKIDEEYFE